MIKHVSLFKHKQYHIYSLWLIDMSNCHKHINMCGNDRCWFQDGNFFWENNRRWDGEHILFPVHMKYSLIKTSFENLTEPILNSSALLSSENWSSFPYPVCSHYSPNTATYIKVSNVSQIFHTNSYLCISKYYPHSLL